MHKVVDVHVCDGTPYIDKDVTLLERGVHVHTRPDATEKRANESCLTLTSSLYPLSYNMAGLCQSINKL